MASIHRSVQRKDTVCFKYISGYRIILVIVRGTDNGRYDAVLYFRESDGL